MKVPFDHLVLSRVPKRGFIVELQGGLGNQLFQFSNAVNLANKFRRPFSLKMRDRKRQYGLDVLGIKEGKFYLTEVENNSIYLTPIRNILDIKLKSEFYVESKFEYSEIDLLPDQNIVRGYFQSYRYFEEIDKAIINYIKAQLSISSNPALKDTVVMHVRLGDMAINPTANEYHGVVTEQYLLEAYEKLGRDKELLVVTDSPNLFCEKYKSIRKLTKKVMSKDTISDFRMLSASHNLVISNSTFSWWGAFVSESRTVAPIKWFTPEILKLNRTIDLYPKNWILI